MKSRLYTRTGDDGTTSLAGGTRTAKNSVRVEAYGTVDELSSAIGVLLSEKEVPDAVADQLREVQMRLFDLGASLASDSKATAPLPCPVTEEDLASLEGWIDSLDSQTPPLNAFVLPGGSRCAADAHMARTICRRAERRILDLAGETGVQPGVTAYINRLSDYLFACARFCNAVEGVGEPTWKPRGRG